MLSQDLMKLVGIDAAALNHQAGCTDFIIGYELG